MFVSTSDKLCAALGLVVIVLIAYLAGIEAGVNAAQRQALEVCKTTASGDKPKFTNPLTGE